VSPQCREGTHLFVHTLHTLGLISPSIADLHIWHYIMSYPQGCLTVQLDWVKLTLS